MNTGNEESTKMKAAILMLATLCTGANSQNVPPALEADPFIRAVKTMKHSMAPLVCIDGNARNSVILTRRGSALFISAAGEFLAAAHDVLDMEKSGPLYPTSAILLPVERWQPDALNENAHCAIDHDIDVAECPLSYDLSSTKPEPGFRIVPVTFEWSIPRDGTQVAFTGFPTGARDPITFRADVVAYRPDIFPTDVSSGYWSQARNGLTAWFLAMNRAVNSLNYSVSRAHLSGSFLVWLSACPGLKRSPERTQNTMTNKIHCYSRQLLPDLWPPTSVFGWRPTPEPKYFGGFLRVFPLIKVHH
jgi:hypothetical protein